MKPIKYAKLLDYINNNHKLGLDKEPYKKIKYVGCNFDNRDGNIYRVELREWMVKKSKTFLVEDYENMYDSIIEWLNEV